MFPPYSMPIQVVVHTHRTKSRAVHRHLLGPCTLFLAHDASESHGPKMPKPKTSTPGDHLLDCLRAPMTALRRSARGEIPLLETSVVAGLGMVGVGWSTSGLVFAQNNAFERFVLGGLQGTMLVVPVLLFIGAANALQPAGPGHAATFRRSSSIVLTGLIGPAVLAVLCGVASLAGPLFLEHSIVALLPALIAITSWLLSLVVMTGLGHGLARSATPFVGVASAVGAFLVTALAVGLATAIYLNPPWATHQPWGFL